MNVEQRLIDALHSADRMQPSPDLFDRVVHSIDEDRLHRRRVRRTALLLAGMGVLVAIAMSLSMVDGFKGRQVRWQTMEAIETIVLVVVIVVLGPAIRRFGRGFVHDLWPASRATASAILRLLDLAYVLVFTGFVLVSCDLAAPELLESALADQLRSSSARLAGLVLTVGVLHVVTIAALPLVALVANSTRTDRPLPRWVVILLAVSGVVVAFVLFNLVAGLVSIGLS